MIERHFDDHSRERQALIKPGEKSEAIRRTVKANHTIYDCAKPPSGRVEKRMMELEAALAETRRKLHAIEDSTIWRSTSKFRQVVQAFKNLRPRQENAPAKTDDSPCRTLTYQDWIDTEESAVRNRLLHPDAGELPVTTPSLGLVLWTDEKQSDVVAQELVDTFTKVPANYDVLFLCPKEVMAAAKEAGAVRPNLIIEAGGSFSDAFSAALQLMKSAYFCFHCLDDQIGKAALELVATALASQPQTDLLFGDEDWLDETGRRCQPFFKPGWDLERQRGQDLIGPFAFYRTALLRRLAVQPSGPAWRYDLAGHVVAACYPERIRHLPAVLCHRRAPLPVGAADAMRRHAKMHLLSSGIVAEVEPIKGPEPWHRVIYALPQSAPLVSIIVPTRDRAHLLRACASGVLNQTSYAQIELLIVDNGTEDTEALALIDSLSQDGRVKILRCPGPFNWSALNNNGVAAAHGNVILLLNNDITVLRPDWLQPLVALAIQPDVGAVGAKLLYQDGRVQHAGITTDIHGVPRHLFRYAQPDDPGPSGMLGVARSVWAVTGACLATRRDVFFEVGGLNEGLPVAYNDVDFCLRLAIQGYRIIWTPDALLEHHELASRPPDTVGTRREKVREELDRLTRDWGNLTSCDPFLNPNYHLVQEHLAFRAGPKSFDGAGENAAWSRIDGAP